MHCTETVLLIYQIYKVSQMMVKILNFHRRMPFLSERHAAVNENLPPMRRRKHLMNT